MVKELQRKCSCCGNNGHNSRTCNGNGTGRVKLFGVDISENKVEQSIKRSFSLGNLKACDEEHNSNVRNVNGNVAGDESGYLSDGLIHNKKRKDAHERKKGVPWSEEEHRTFLAGLESVGRGNWREIARRFVTTRTPTQVASHAQKYFIRKTAKDKKKRRSSLFDMHLKELDMESKTFPSSTAMKSAEISSQEKASTSQTLSSEAAADRQNQTKTAKLVNQFPHLCLDGLPGVPNYQAIPCLVGDPPRVAFIPVNATEFGKQNISTRNTSVSMICETSVSEHPSGIPSPKSNSHKSSISGESEKDGLERKIGQSQTSTSSINIRVV